MRATGTSLVIAGLHPQPKKAIEHAELDKEIGAENICPDMQSAISRSRSLLAARKLSALRAKRAKSETKSEG
jgi:hypothetical protein